VNGGHRSGAAIDRFVATCLGKGASHEETIVAFAIAAALAPAGALAQERLGDAALGAVSGAVVLGPVGAVAGAAIGYTAGPAIASSWGLRRHHHRHHHRKANSE
jgi:hypothetical protein